MRLRRRQNQSLALIDVTPMADMVFLLLIFFMLSSTFIVQPGIQIRLPKTQSAQADPQQTLVLSITKDGGFFVGARRVALAGLTDELRREFGGRTDRTLLVNADERVAHGTVVQALDYAKKAGAQKLAIASERIAPPKGER